VSDAEKKPASDGEVFVKHAELVATKNSRNVTHVARNVQLIQPRRDFRGRRHGVYVRQV
jgi:hypothetical protein